MTEPGARRSRRLVHAALAVVALGCGAAGCRCNREVRTAQPGSHRAPIFSPASQPASQPRLRRMPPPPPATPGTTMTSKDGLVRVTTPAGAGWECLEQLASAGTPAGGTLMKCRRPKPELFLLVAKDYEVDQAAVLSPEKVAMEERPKHFQRLFSTHEIVRNTPAKHQGAVGHEIEFVAKLRGRQELHGLEQVYTKGTHVLQISAEGRRADFDKYQGTIKPWLEATTFKVLGQ